MTAPDKQQQQAEAEAAERERIKKEFEDGYPTRETIAEFLEAKRTGGKEAIKALLERRRALRLNETDEPASDA